MTRQHHHSASPYERTIGFSRAVRAGDRILVSGTAPIGPDGNSWPGDAYEQAARCFAVALEALTALGGTPADVVRTRMYLVDPADADLVGRAHAEAVGAASPAATMVVVAALLRPEWRVEIELEAIGPGGGEVP